MTTRGRHGVRKNDSTGKAGQPVSAGRRAGVAASMKSPQDRRDSQPRPKGPDSTAARGKAAVRQELEQATERHLREGGEVSRVPAGASAWEVGTRPPPSRPLFAEQSKERTPLGDVIARLEARREAMKARRRQTAKPRRQRARRRIIYDDFGEPIRRVWDED